MPSIRGRLTLILVLALGLLLLGSGGLLYTVIRAQLVGEFDRALFAKVQTLMALTEYDGTRIELDLADVFMPEFEADDTPEYFALWHVSGQLIDKSRSLAEHDFPLPATLTTVPVFRNVMLPDGRSGRLVEIAFVPRVDSNNDEQTEPAEAAQADEQSETDDTTLDPRLFPDRTAVFLVARGREALDTLLRTLRLALAIVIVGSLAVMIGVVRFALRLGLRPLDDIRQQVDHLDARSLTTGIQVKTQTCELAPVVAQLNALLSRLDAAFMRERQFGSDVAHELRTPVAELRTLTEVGGRWPDDTKAVTQYFADAHAISLQMERIVVSLLTLARCEGGTVQVSTQRLKLGDLVAASWASVERLAQEKALTFQGMIPSTCCVTSDRDVLLTMLHNLFSNAVTYSPPQSTIHCVAKADGDVLHLSLGNVTEDLTPEDIPHLFERFWRKDPARTAGDNAGLGLAIVQALSALLGLEVHAALDAEHNFAITLSFPCASIR